MQRLKDESWDNYVARRKEWNASSKPATSYLFISKGFVGEEGEKLQLQKKGQSYKRSIHGAIGQ
jgi:hypothetical protein